MAHRKLALLLVALVLFMRGSVADPAPAHADTLSASRPLTSSGLLNPEFQISSLPMPGDPERPAVAYNANHNEYLVVWLASPSILYGQRVTSSGSLAGSAFPIYVGRQPAVSYNPITDQFLVVWSLETDAGQAAILGRLVSWDGSTLGDAFVIWSWVNRRLTHPRVAWNSQRNEYFVVWAAADSNTHEATDIAGRPVSASGVPGGSVTIISMWDKPDSPDITFNPGTDPYSIWSNRYYVVWRALDNAHAGSRAIIGALGNSAGSNWSQVEYLNDRRDFIAPQEPAVASNPLYYFTAWREVASGAQVQARAISLYGVPSTLVLHISGNMDQFTSGPPGIAAVPGITRKFLVVWIQETIVGRSVLASQCDEGIYFGIECQMMLVRAETIGPYSYIARPAAVGQGSSYLIAYGASIPQQQVYGRLLWTSALYLPLIRH